jgi:two-component system, LytTR family, response regulator LytT
MTSVRVLIAEDEAVVARRIARLTTEVLADRAELSFARNVAETRRTLESFNADLLILDLNLEGDEGFALLRDAAARPFETIVVSAHTERALEAFEYGVRDFVPKPFGRERLELALSRALHSLRPSEPTRYLGVRRQGSTELLPVEEVMFIRGAGTQSELVLRNKSHVRHTKLLDRLETALPPHFERIHKSFIVNMREVVRLETHEGSRYSVVLTNGTTLPVGRTRVDALRKKFA